MDKTAQRHLKTVLLVDDDDVYRISTKWFLANFGYTVVSVRTAEEALAQFDPEIHDVVVTDHDMPGVSGVEMAHIIKLRSPFTPVIMCSTRSPEDQSSLDVVFEKPTHLLVLKDALDKLVAARQPAIGCN